MYNNNRRQGPESGSSRPSYSSGGNAERSRFRGGGGRNFRRGGNRGRHGGAYIDERKFVATAKKPQDKVAVASQWMYADLDLHPRLKSNVLQKGYKTPTPIQEQAIPAGLSGKDILGIANTGTGKTAAFLIPLIQKVISDRRKRVLVITPTRELAEQISDELYMLSLGLDLSMALCIGGASMGMQLSRLRRNPIFVVGTPGRLLDHVNRKSLDLSKFDTIVLDEVDRMLDMGFINDIKTLSASLPKERQSLFFSATMDDKIEQIIRLILKQDHAKISVKTGETAEFVDQSVVHYSGDDEKFDKLRALLEHEESKRVLVFINMKWHVDKIEKQLQKMGFRVQSLHGDKRQSQRSRAVSAFKEGHVNILLATDVAARGLDINDITHVINYDVPKTYEEYVHRIGRTGRANKAGNAITFVPQRKPVTPGFRGR